MSDEEEEKELLDQDPDLKEDFGRAEWPFSDKGGLDDIPVPAGEACAKISSVLSHASEHSGDFSFGGQAEQLPAIPGLFVDEVGPIPVPLWDERARELIDKAEKSPFGHNMDTKLDENVRKSWQISADHVQVKNPQWKAGIEKMAVMIANKLGYKDIHLQCILYKLLIYEEGGHFVKHQDTEKEDGMIATLVIQPPSLHEGGDLVVYGGGMIKHRHDFGKTDETATYLPHYAVHYADAEHALETVTKGYRLALVYSVCLPPTMHQLERNPNRPMAGELVDPMESMEPSDSFALLLSHEYTKNSIKGLGSHALKGVDRARFCALEEANAALSDGKKLEFVIAELYHHVRFYGRYDSIGDWDEDSRDEKVTWYFADGEHLGLSDKLPVKLNFLNPIQETRAQLWMEPYGSSDMHGYLGNEGPSKDSRYNRCAIVAWPKADRVEKMLKLINVEDVLGALESTEALDSLTFHKFMELASVKVAQVAEVMAKLSRQDLIHYENPYAVSRWLGDTVCKLSGKFGDPALVNLFFQAFFKQMTEKDTIVSSVVAILKTFQWCDVGESLLDALSPGMQADKYLLKVTVEIVQGLENGPAHRALLKHAVERAKSVEDADLSSSDPVKDLWKLVLWDSDEDLLATLSDKFIRLNPLFLGSTIEAFSSLWRDPNLSTLKKAMMVSIAARRSEWLESQIQVLEQPFTWKMPVAEFPDSVVEGFLRGPDSTMTTPGVTFDSTYEAKGYSFRFWSRYSQVSSSFSMKTGGAGSDAFITFSKTRSWYNENKAYVPFFKEELKELKAATVETLVAVVSESASKKK